MTETDNINVDSTYLKAAIRSWTTNLTIQEIADSLDISTSTVSKAEKSYRRHQAEILKTYFAENEDEERAISHLQHLLIPKAHRKGRGTLSDNYKQLKARVDHLEGQVKALMRSDLGVVMEKLNGLLGHVDDIDKSLTILKKDLRG